MRYKNIDEKLTEEELYYWNKEVRKGTNFPFFLGLTSLVFAIIVLVVSDAEYFSGFMAVTTISILLANQVAIQNENRLRHRLIVHTLLEKRGKR